MRCLVPPALLFACAISLVVAEDAAPRQVDLRLTGAPLTVNGQETVPVGLFGLHAVGLSPELVEDLGVEAYRTINFVPGGGSRIIGKKGEVNEVYAGLDVFIDCQGDRFYEPLPLRNKDYAAACARMGRAYGELWKNRLDDLAPHSGIVQWWNEPYLNWAERSAGSRGSTISQQWYDLSRAVEGGPVTIKGWDRPLSYFRWRSRWPVYYEEGTDKKGRPFRRMEVGWSVPIPAGVADGGQFQAAEGRYWRDPGTVKTWTVERHWFPEDPTRVGFWSGRQNRELYQMMFEPWARALREANPAVTILGGWDFNYSAGGWATWVELYRPLLRDHPELIDGITEHHYGIPPTIVQAWYELGTGDGMALTGRWLKNWNTECQGRLDPAVYGRSSNASGGTASQNLFEANYNLADMIGLAARMPAKVGSRTAHNFAGKNFADCGAAWALRLLKPLRGRLLAVEVDDQGCFAVASRRPEGGVALALFNQRRSPMRIRGASPGVGSVQAQRLVAAEDGALSIATADLDLADGQWAIELASQHAAVLLIEGLPESDPVVRQQFFPAQPGLQRYGGNPKWPLEQTVAIDAEALTQARAAHLRVVFDGDPSGAVLRLGEQEIVVARDLPVTDIPLPLAALSAGDNQLAWAGSDGYRLVTASIILER